MLEGVIYFLEITVILQHWTVIVTQVHFWATFTFDYVTVYTKGPKCETHRGRRVENKRWALMRWSPKSTNPKPQSIWRMNNKMARDTKLQQKAAKGGQTRKRITQLHHLLKSDYVLFFLNSNKFLHAEQSIYTLWYCTYNSVNDLNTLHLWISLKHSCLNGAIYFTFKWKVNGNHTFPVSLPFLNEPILSLSLIDVVHRFHQVRKSDAVCEQNTRGTCCLFSLRPSTFQRKCVQFYAHVVST